MSILRLGHKTKGSSEEKQSHKTKRAKSLYNTEQHLLNGHNTFLLEKQNIYSKMVQASSVTTHLLPADIVYGNVPELFIHGWLTFLARHYV